MKDESYAQRRFERTRAHFEKINADRALARKVSKAWGRLTHPAQALFDYRKQIQKFADLYDLIATTRRRTFHRVKKRHPER